MKVKFEEAFCSFKHKTYLIVTSPTPHLNRHHKLVTSLTNSYQHLFMLRRLYDSNILDNNCLLFAIIVRCNVFRDVPFSSVRFSIHPSSTQRKHMKYIKRRNLNLICAKRLFFFRRTQPINI